MSSTKRRPILMAAMAGALVLASCGGGDSDSTEASTPPPDTNESPPETDVPTDTSPADTDPPPTAEIDSVEGIRPAVVQILAQGSFRDPAEGQQTGGWSGSGFIISPDGLVVTNNHVVTGAGVVQVVLENGEEIPAQVLGVSECNDLAVLQITDPGPYSYLEWSTEAVAPTLEVYAAGFPLGDPEYTITRGIVSKAEADGETNWASVRRVIEHDAATQPGNSGGPLVTSDGKVVAINYRGDDPGTGTIQYVSIAADLAQPVVEELKNGDAETIGVNGTAITSDDGTEFGVWVSAVEAGTPASNAGVLPGDIITTLNGVPMSEGTMESYCDVLRSSVPGDPIAIQVFRIDTDEVWAGELNGEPMTARQSFAAEFEGDVADDSASATAYQYESIVDDTETITMSIPTLWAQRETAPTDLGLSSGPSPSLVAAPNLEGFYNTYLSPGALMFGVPTGGSELGTTGEVLDLIVPDDPGCVFNERSPYEDPAFVGEFESWFCEQSVYITLAASAIEAPDAMIVVAVVAVTEADLEAFDEITASFNFL